MNKQPAACILANKTRDAKTLGTSPETTIDRKKGTSSLLTRLFARRKITCLSLGQDMQ